MYKLCNMRKWACLFLILSLTLCALPGSANVADSEAEEESQLSEADQQIADFRAEIERLREEQLLLDQKIATEKEQVGGALQQKTLMDQQIFLLSSEIACFDLLLECYDALLDRQETEYDALSISYDNRFASLIERLRQTREEEMPGKWEVFCRAESFLDLLIGLERLKQIEEYDRSLMKSLEEDQILLADLRGQMDEYRYDRHNTALERAKRMQQLNMRLQESGNFLQSLMGDVNRFSYYVQQTQAGKQRADRMIADRVQTLLDRIATEGNGFLLAEQEAKLQTAGEAIGAQMEQGSLQKGAQFYEDGAAYIWPLVISPDKEASVLSHMGYRTYQVGGKLITSYHSGVDLAADYGSSVVAAASGKVISTEYFDGYGICVVILHADGSQTRYAYLGKALVEIGEYVLQGEIIATAGVSGNSAGIGCHFEIVQNGAPLDPLQYLTVPKSDLPSTTTE